MALKAVIWHTVQREERVEQPEYRFKFLKYPFSINGFWNSINAKVSPELLERKNLNQHDD